LGFTAATAESFSVHALTSAGVPTATPVQTLTVKPALSQFYIHPNGTVAYAMFSWTEVVDSTTEFASDIVLFTINPKIGKLTNTAKNIANFPLNEGTSTSMTYVNTKGTELYTEDFWAGFCHTCVGPSYYYSNINAKTGLLSPRVYFWADNDTDAVGSFFGDSILVYDPFGVYSMGPKPSLLAPCDPSTLAVCGDYIFSVYIHPSDKYIFLADQTLNEVPILYISLPKKELEASGASIPGNPSTVAFSPDGLLVYAVEGNEILVYVFNPHTGLLTAEAAITVPAGTRLIVPAQ
jgi:hypothetical protein